MEELNKTQIVLLTLLVSFVTSIATGIVTVTLMDQAPPAVTQTINHVVEKTIETVVPGEVQKTTVVTKQIKVRDEDQIVNAVAKNQKAILTIGGVNMSGAIDTLGIGSAISSDGLVVVDKSKMLGNRNNLVISKGGLVMEAAIVGESPDGYYLLQADLSTATSSIDTSLDHASSTVAIPDVSFSPLVLADSDQVKLGQTAIAINERSVATGIVSGLSHADSSSDSAVPPLVQIETTIPNNPANAGGPVLNLDGSTIGINVLNSDGMIITLPSNSIKDTMASISVATDTADTIESK